MTAIDAAHRVILDQYNKEIKARNIVALREIKNTLVMIFGEDFHQITMNDMYQQDDNRLRTDQYRSVLDMRVGHIHYTVTIHFPEIDISNTEGQHHTIKDLYVRFYFNGKLQLAKQLIEDAYEYAYLSGLRTTFTKAEYYGNYAHSHLPYRALKFQKFCTGTGPINQLMPKLMSGYNLRDFQLFLQTIKLYIKHESLEGRPHQYIRDLQVSEHEIHLIYLPDDQLARIATLVYQVFLTNFKMLTYTIEADKVQVNVSDEFSIKMAETLAVTTHDDISQFNMGNLCPFRNAEGRYISSTAARSNTPITIIPLITFKGQIKELYVGNGNESTIAPIRYTNPVILQRLCQQFGKSLTTAAVRMQNPGW